MNYSANYIRIGMWMNGIFYMPENNKKDTAILVIHSDADYLNFPAGRGLASNGYPTLCANISRPIEPLERKLLEVKDAMEYLKGLDWVKHVVILGHSGGATLMSCYQAVAENGCKVFQDDKKIVKMEDIPELPKADACLFLDSNFGNGAMTLFSLDPCIEDETSGVKLNHEYDVFASENGFKEGSTRYSEEFKEKFFKAQAERNNRLIDFALSRVEALNSHRGNYFDDEPFIVPGGSQIAPNNKLFPQDMSLLAHTKEKHDLVHKDGSVTNEIVYSLRKPRGNRSVTPIYGLATMATTIKTYITNNVVRTTEGFKVTETGVEGIDWDSSFCCTPGNIQHITSPVLIMGMTGGYEYAAAELLYNMCPSKDKSLGYIEGASHMLMTAKECESYPGEYGDTVETLFSYVAKWLDRRF